MRKILLFLVIPAILAAPAAAAAGELTLTIRNGLVTINADDVPLSTIMAEWARVGQTKIVNGEKMMTRVSLNLVDVPERRALDVLLRSASGFMASERRLASAGASVFDSIMILPTSTPPAYSPIASPPPTFVPRPVAQPAVPQPQPGEPDDEPVVPPGMEAQPPPVYIVSLGRTYRRDTPDATHTPIFHQVEGLAVDEGITLADLAGTLDFLLKALFGPERRTRLRTHYFPFTEPSIEPDVSCHVCDGSGCPVCRHSGWIELGGAGMVDPTLFEFVGYDPERYTGFAFGIGLERIAMLRHEFPDLRELWRNDLRFSRQF